MALEAKRKELREWINSLPENVSKFLFRLDLDKLATVFMDVPKSDFREMLRGSMIISPSMRKDLINIGEDPSW